MLSTRHYFSSFSRQLVFSKCRRPHFLFFQQHLRRQPPEIIDYKRGIRGDGFPRVGRGEGYDIASGGARRLQSAEGILKYKGIFRSCAESLHAEKIAVRGRLGAGEVFPCEYTGKTAGKVRMRTVDIFHLVPVGTCDHGGRIARGLKFGKEVLHSRDIAVVHFALQAIEPDPDFFLKRQVVLEIQVEYLDEGLSLDFPGKTAV